jgi:hypothetical protein
MWIQMVVFWVLVMCSILAAVCSSKTQIHSQNTTLRNNPEDHHLNCFKLYGYFSPVIQVNKDHFMTWNSLSGQSEHPKLLLKYMAQNKVKSPTKQKKSQSHTYNLHAFSYVPGETLSLISVMHTSRWRPCPSGVEPAKLMLHGCRICNKNALYK